MTNPSPHILDAHVHLWDTSRFDLRWLADMPELASRYEAVDLCTAAAGASVRGVVAVQAGESAGEAAWLLGDDTGAAAASALPSRVVLQYEPSPEGWLGAVHQVAVSRLDRIAGIRIPLHGRPADWTDLDGLSALLNGLEECGLVLELLLRPDQVAAVHDLAEKRPRLEIVLCHLGLSTADPTPEWRTALAKLAVQPNVSAKISGLFRSPLAPDARDTRPQYAVAHALDALGPDRLMFGSDWPMSTRVGTYEHVIERTRLQLGGLTPDESAAIWARTAGRIYGVASTR